MGVRVSALMPAVALVAPPFGLLASVSGFAVYGGGLAVSIHHIRPSLASPDGSLQKTVHEAAPQRDHNSRGPLLEGALKAQGLLLLGPKLDDVICTMPIACQSA